MNKISNSVIELYNQLGQGESMPINEEMVKKAINVVLYLHPKNEDEVFLMLCALNLLNAAIKTELFKDKLSYDLIKSNAAKIVAVIDTLNNNDVSYYYNKDEYCLYLKYCDVVFSFHHVPLTNEILKASFARPISWPGIRLQKIAQSLMDLAIKSFENDIEVKEMIEKPAPTTDEINTEYKKMDSHDSDNQDKPINKDDASSLNDNSSEIRTIPDEERDAVAKKILAIISKSCAPDSEGWYDLVKIAPKLKAHGVDYSLYGFNKLILFLEAIFGDSLHRRNVGDTIVYLWFPLDKMSKPSDIVNNVERNQESFDILDGVQLGDDVEISTYGIIKSGKISLLTKQFVQLELKDNRSIRIRCDAISSIESHFSLNSVASIDLSFASAIIKDVLIAEDLYSSSTIVTNATITMVESRRIWLTTDDSNTGSCYKGSIIGYNKEKLVKGQRVYVSSLKKEKAYLVLLEMSYYELYEVLENLLFSSNKISDFKKSQILFLLTFVMKNINHTESLVKIKELRRQLKNLMYSSTSSSDEIEEDIKNGDEVEKELITEIQNENEASSVDDEMKPLDNINKQEKPSDSSFSDIYKTEVTSIQGPKIIGKIDLTDNLKTKKKNGGDANDTVEMDPNNFISIDYTNDLLPSMGKIIKLGPSYGFIEPYNLDINLYFKTGELVSYVGIIDVPSIGDEVIYSLGQNSQGQPIAICVHKQCTRDVVEDLIEKFRYDSKICTRLKKHIEDFDNYHSETNDDTKGLVFYLNKVGVKSKTSFSPDDVEKRFAENLSSDEYATAIEYLIDEVAKRDRSKCYNLFLRSSSYTKSHKMYDVSKHLIEKALVVFKREPGKTKYFKGLLKTINVLSSRIEINENTLAKNLELSGHIFPFMPTYVRDIILTNKDFNGIKQDKDTIRTGLYKEGYIEELNENIKQNGADDLLYLTMMKLQLAFHPKEYNPKDDITKFLVTRAKNILAIGDENRYSDVRYLLRLAYRLKSFEKGFDDTVGLYLMTLGDYTVSEIDMYMRGQADRGDYKIDDMLKNILENEVDNTLELTLFAESNATIKNRIIREYEKSGKNIDSFDEYPTILNEIKKRYIQYAADPTINFMSFISYLQTTSILLDNEMNVVKNELVKIVSDLTDFITGQKYNAIRDAYNNIILKIDSIIPNLIDLPTEIGYETILPALRLLKKNVRSKFEEIEQRVDPTILIDILEAVGLEDTNSTELKVDIRNSGDSARSVHINSLKVSGDDLVENNNINIDVRLSAGGDKLVNVELPLSNNVVEEKIAEVEFVIEYDDIYIATNQRIPRSSKIYKTINFEIKPFVEIDNRFRQCAGGEELESGDSMFYGRSKLIIDIQEAILKGVKNQIAIYGQRRSGKSSLLNQIKGRLESDESHSIICGKFSLLSLPADEPNPAGWILKSIALSLLQGIRSHGVGKLDKSVVAKFFSEESDPFMALGDFIGHIKTVNVLQDSHFVIFIDEFTKLYQLIKDGKIKDDFLQRWIAQTETPGFNLQVIIAAQDTFPHFMNESYASNCFNKFNKEPLSYLSKEETLQLIKEPIKDVKFHNNSESLIYDYTSGHAFFTQIFCTKLVDYLNSMKTNVVGKEEIEIVAERLCTGTHRLEPSTFECLTKEADGSNFNEPDNIRVLKAIAERTRAGGYVNIEDLNVDSSQEELKSILDNLYARRVISKQDKGYSINVKLFVKWMLNN